MKIGIFKRFFLLLITFSMSGQTMTMSKVVADKESKKVLEFVNVFNSIDNSLTNEDGRFVFLSIKDEINFSRIGYRDICCSFSQLKEKDTVFMEPAIINLDEVLISNPISILKQAHNKIENNYLLSPSTDNFF